MKLSEEQQLAVDTARNYNVAISACAGAGKTTTCLNMVEGQTLLMTYNRSLMLETKEKARSKNINLDIYTYHSFAGRCFGKLIKDDTSMETALNNDMEEFSCKLYDRVIIDEIQDVNEVYYLLIKCILAHLDEPRIIILGDEHQNIYRSTGSDPNYLILAEHIYPGVWKHVRLSRSFRVPKPVADFINESCLGGEKRIISDKPGPKPRIIIGSVYSCREMNPKYVNVSGADTTKGFSTSCFGCDDCKGSLEGCFNNHELVREIKYYLQLGYKANDIFILAPFVGNTRSPFTNLGNYMSRRNNDLPPVYLCNDESQYNDEVAKNKVALCTFHKSKGRERPVVIILGFDSVMLHGNMQSPCPNHLYVALTRTQKHLTLFQSYRTQPLPFVKIGTYANVLMYRPQKIRGTFKNTDKSVTKFVKFRNRNVIKEVLSLYDIIQIQEEGSRIYPSSTCKQQYGVIDIVEDVSRINGLALDLYIAHKRGFPVLDYNFSGELNLPKYLRMVNKHICSSGEFISYNQISKYNWMTRGMFDKLVKRCDKNIDIGALFHRTARRMTSPNGFMIIGECDALMHGSVLELKCVSSLNDSHYLQTIVYMWMFEKQLGYLYNAVDNSKYKIVAKSETSNLNAIALLYNSHVQDEVELSDEEFINRVKSL